MREVFYYESEDGKKFDNYWDCKNYERNQFLQKSNSDFKFFDEDGNPIGIEQADTSKVNCIVIKTRDAADVVERWFEDDSWDSPFEGCGVGNEIGTWKYNDLNDEWEKLEDKLIELSEFINKVNKN